MKYDSFQQLIDTMDSAGYDYKKEISKIEERKNNFSTGVIVSLELHEHVKTMIYAQLSNNRPWKTIEENIELIDNIFDQYNIEYLKNENPEIFIDKIRKIRCGNRQIQRQMFNLKHNIEVLEKIKDNHGSVDNFLKSENIVTVIKSLSQPTGRYKLKNMGVALVCEYLKGIGIEVVKPDTLLRRLIGRLGYSQNNPASEWEAIEICQEIGSEYGISQTMVDTILWQYCAEGKFEICTATPKCDKCLAGTCPYRK